MPGLVIPNVFVGGSPSPVSKLDQDLAVVASYINARNPTFGLLSARPAAGNAGAVFIATDVGGGTTYTDNGAAWVQSAAPVVASSLGMYGSRNLKGNNNAGTPNTKYDFSADTITAFDPALFSTTTLGITGTLTCDIGAAGPVINGRDQAGAFVNGSWVYFYLLINPLNSTKATIASATAWPTGPVLPGGGYTVWLPLAAVYLSGGGALLGTVVRGNRIHYNPLQNALTAGGSTAEATVSLAALIPPIADNVFLYIQDLSGTVNASGQMNLTCALKTTTGVTLRTINANWSGLANAGEHIGVSAGEVMLPNVSQQYIYQLTQSLGTVPQTTHDCVGYTVPNGGI